MKIGSLDRRSFLKTGAAAATSSVVSALGVTQAAGVRQTAMRTNLIPGTTEALPVVGIGASPVFRGEPEEGRELSKQVLQSVYDMGGRVVDTPSFFRPNPPLYFGELMHEMGLADDLFLIGKTTVNDREATIKHMEKTVAALGKRPMDVMLVHNMRAMDENWPVLKEWKDQGRVRYIGVSLTRQTDYSPLEDFMKAERPDFVMTGYSITQQGPAEGVLPLAQDLDIGILGVEPFKAFDDGAFFSMVAGKELPEWCAEFDCESWAQFSLKWILSNPAMTTVIMETSKVKHVIDNMGAGYGELPDQATRKRMSDYLLSLY